MIKLLVQSTLIMSEDDLRWYAYRNSERAKNLSPEQFLKELHEGKQIVVEFPDKTITAYQIVEGLQ